MVENAQGLVPVRRQPFERPVGISTIGNRDEESIEAFLHDGLAQRCGAFPAAVEIPYPFEHGIGRRVASARIADNPPSMNNEMLRTKFHRQCERTRPPQNQLQQHHLCNPALRATARRCIYALVDPGRQSGICHEHGLRTCRAREGSTKKLEAKPCPGYASTSARHAQAGRNLGHPPPCVAKHSGTLVLAHFRTSTLPHLDVDT